MKKYLLLIFILFSLTGFSQIVDIKIKKEKLDAAKSIRDIIPGIPDDCKVQTFVMSLTVHGSYKELTEVPNLKAESKNHEEFSEMTHSLLVSVEKGKFFFIEKVQSTCGIFFKSKRYKITVE